MAKKCKMNSCENEAEYGRLCEKHYYDFCEEKVNEYDLDREEEFYSQLRERWQ